MSRTDDSDFAPGCKNSLTSGGKSKSPSETKVIASTYKLVGPDGRVYLSPTPGLLGGHKRGKRYGLLDCPAALRALAKGGYVKHRVFFADAITATSAGYRPCAVCMPDQFKEWKET